MYDSFHEAILIDDETKNGRTDVLCGLYGMGFNLIPMNGKKPCVEWKLYQTQRVSPAEIKEWMRGRFPTRNGKSLWHADILNFALLTGAIPWSSRNPGLVVLDPDDEEADELVMQHCPPTPMVQLTGSGLHRVYRRPSVEDVRYIPNRQKTWIDGRQYNLDLRGDGGYIMAPGSIHPITGSPYQEEVPWTLDLLMQSPVYDPTWLTCEGMRKPTICRTTVVVSCPIDAASHDEQILEIDGSLAERERQARIYLEAVPGTQEGTGADRSCTALTMRLLCGFALPADTVLEMLAEWGKRADQLDKVGGWYPWTEEELARKIQWCLGQHYGGEVGDKLHAIRDLDEMEADVDEIVEPFDVAATVNTKRGVVIDPKDQLATATKFFNSEYGGNTLVHHQGCWYLWNGKHYETVSDDDIKARLWKWLAKCRHWSKAPDKSKDVLQQYQPNRSAVSGVLDALRAVANHPSVIEPPCWLSEGTVPDPANVIAFDNGLLDVEAYLSGLATLLPHSPRWFSTNCLPHEFDPRAPYPHWQAFLEQVFDGDEERIAALQQWFGYNLIADNRQHKMALLIGPPRSGKGTTMAVMSEMLGRHNVANSSLASLGGRFGLEPLVGKLAALIDEGHLGKFSDTSLVLERLKAISGGSEQTVDRKGLPAMSNVALKLRFTIAVNELPRLSDASAAMRSRLLVLPYFNSYEGREDFGLVDRLLTEIPGITNWALEGLRLLRNVGRFKNTTAGEKILRDFVYLSSPVQAFLDECCEVGVDKEVRRNDLQLAWRIWCDENGHVPGSVADFGKKLRAALPRIDDERRRVDGRRERWDIGIGLTAEAHTVAANRRMVAD